MIIRYLTIFALLLVLSFISKITLLSFDPHIVKWLFSAKGWQALFWGLRLDATAVAAVLIPAAIALIANAGSRIIKPLIFLAALWLVLTTLADAVYMQQAGRHLTFEVFMSDGSEAGLIATLFTSYLAATLSAFLVLILFSVALYFLPLAKHEPTSAAYKILFTLVWLAASVTVLRGGWNDAPQSPMSVYKIGNDEQALIAWNAPYAVTYYLARGKKKAAKQLTPEPSAKDFALMHSIVPQQASPSAIFLPPSRQANILLVLLESWSAYDLYSYSQRQNSAPNFDQLRKDTFSTQAFYADGYRTVEGMFATFCSYPNPIGGGVAGTQLQSAQYQCLPKVLNQHGWETSFIQGSGKGIVGAFAQSLGFEHSYGKTDYPFDGIRNYWGYMDGDIYKFSLDKIKSAKQPYFIAINTGSTHDLFLPEQDDYVFGSETYEQKRQSVVHHADAALNQFLDNLQQVVDKPTLIILQADHTGGLEPDGLNQNAIPFLMFATDGSVEKRHFTGFASQKDIAPTVMQWLGGYVPWFTGGSLLSEEQPRFVQFSRGRSASWIEQSNMVRFDVTQFEHYECFHVAEDGISNTNVPCASNSVFEKLFQRAQAYVRVTQKILFSGETAEFNHLIRPSKP